MEPGEVPKHLPTEPGQTPWNESGSLNSPIWNRDGYPPGGNTTVPRHLLYNLVCRGTFPCWTWASLYRSSVVSKRLPCPWTEPYVCTHSRHVQHYSAVNTGSNGCH